MQVIQVVIFSLLIPLVIYRIANAYWKRSLSTWLKNISLQYGFKTQDYDFFYKKLIAMDNVRSVVIFLDEDKKEHGHIIGFADILNCELIIHETSKDRKSHSIDRIYLELQLKTGHKTITFPLYERNFFASLNKKKLQLRAVEWYENIVEVAGTNAELISRIA